MNESGTIHLWRQSRCARPSGLSACSPHSPSLITRVRLEFELENPGFTLFVNPGVRSLDLQIEHWNSNASVAEAAEELLVAATAYLASSAIAEANTPNGRDGFADFLLAHSPTRAPTIAAPGLSPHGQMRAVDFHVESGGNPVAGPDTQTIEEVWLVGGWRDRLSAAVIASGAEFVGPLEKPDEPWHYSYRGSFEPTDPMCVGCSEFR